MRVREEFSRYAAQYEKHHIIQTKVAQKLISDTHTSPRRILDLGCGSGTLFSNIPWEIDAFTAVDFSESMLSHHPHPSNVSLMLGDFNDPALFTMLGSMKFDHIYSASALQWAQDHEHIFEALGSQNTPLSLALFTSGTFKTLYEIASLPPILKSAEELVDAVSRHFKADFEIVRYTLAFDSVREMFRYIKRSGVSGGRRVLSFSQTKSLMQSYSLDHLEFEVLFISKS